MKEIAEKSKRYDYIVELVGNSEQLGESLVITMIKMLIENPIINYAGDLVDTLQDFEDME